MILSKKVFFSFFLIVFLFVGCSNNNKDNKDYVTVNDTEPLNLLVPSNSNEYGGSRIVHLLFSGLIYFDENANAKYDIAEYIKTDDNQHFIVKIRDDAIFSDGTDVKSYHFVNAWNLEVKEQHRNANYLNIIKGFPITDKEKKSFTKLSGLKIIDDKTFSIDLKKPTIDFIVQLGQTPFLPLHDLAFKDFDKYGNYPIGNGPYKLTSPDSWKHNLEITLDVNPKYIGPRKPQNKGIKFIFYVNPTAAYADLLSNELDVLDAIPKYQLTLIKKDLPNRWLSEQSAFIRTIEINVNQKHFGMDKEGYLRRKAISMAINRKEISKIIFDNHVIPASDFIPTIISKEKFKFNEASVLEYNPKEAKKLWDEADKISKFNDTFSIAYNEESGNREWLESVTNSISNVLKIKTLLVSYPDFKSFLTDIKNRKIKYGFIRGWMADYPGMINFLEQPFSTLAIGTKDFPGLNNTNYSNKNFDILIELAKQSSSLEESKKYIIKMEKILLEDLPAIPLWYNNTVLGFSKNVSNVKIGYNGIPIYYLIKKIPPKR